MFQLVLNNLAERIILQFMRCNIRDKTQVDDSFAYILNYIDMNATQNLTVKQLASNIGYNYNYFRELFFSKKGISLKEYLLEKKISCAEKLLISTDYTLNKIATACGFNSASHFCTVFKKQKGITSQVFKAQSDKNSYSSEEKYYLPPEFSRKLPK